ncbi:HD domain-containing protein [Rubrimonas cliftonensis]|uniref:Guanosine-3',5'-bis(Diphosphate) 3'-pyrophosphohydrolase n=1 Tax=Rubrimonas cliftonensis TaxID=89524 RepID=A0A1H4A7E1_9RHOB|nr:HD domain-containing protein [Rubrimonas cliftonensis]SEA31939.1 guanosine-3',5'-bis(diphosphate) 3'-pyrophosphohydrolase [Rubrimonas cliftonensis]
MIDLVRIADAYALAAHGHAGQTRKGPGDIPYINHPCDVAALVARHGGSPEAVLAAVLHDMVEDTDATVAGLAERFGAEVAGVVDELTDREGWEALPLAERKALQAAHIRGASASARLVKLADQTSNVADLAQMPAAKNRARNRVYLDGARAIAAACQGVSPGLEAEFEKASAALEAALEQTGSGPRQGGAQQ